MMPAQGPLRAVVASFTKTKRQMELKLECGHRIIRRLGHPPEKIACPKCRKERRR